MDTKHKKRCKHPKKMKPSMDNGKAEVFVLPPDLLKKLGISLGSVSKSHDAVPDFKVAGEKIENEQFNNYSKLTPMSGSSDDTSILETANLMKKSVFLSPTFVSTVANMFPGEMEIASVAKELDVPIMATEIKAINSTILPVDNIDISDMCIIEPATSTEESLIINSSMNGVFSTVSNIEHDNTAHIYKSISSNNNITVSSDMAKNIVDHHVDEEYLMNYDNYTSEHIHDPSQVINTQAQKNVSKINIISEEIINPSNVKGLKKIPIITDLTPVTIDTKIGMKINDTVHKTSHNSLNCSGSQLHRTDVLISDGNITKENCGSITLNEINSKASVTQNNINAFTEYFPEKNNCAVTPIFDNNSSHVVNPKNTPPNNSDGNSSNQINEDKHFDNTVNACHVENNTVSNNANIGNFSSEVAIINSFDTKAYPDLNINGIKLHQNELRDEYELVDMDVDSTVPNLIQTTLHVKQDDSVIKLNLNNDCNNVNDHTSSQITSINLVCLKSNNSNSENKTEHNSEGNVENKSEYHGDLIGEIKAKKLLQQKNCIVISYPNENEVLMVDDNSKIPKEKKGALNLLKKNDYSTIFTDKLSVNVVSLVTNDNENNEIKKKDNPSEVVDNNLIHYPAKDETYPEIDENIVTNGIVISSNVCHDNSNYESNIVRKERVLSTVNNKVNDANRDGKGHRNIDLEICANKSFAAETKEFKLKVSTNKIKHDYINSSDSHHCLISPTVSDKNIEDYDLTKSRPLVNGSNGGIQQDEQIIKKIKHDIYDSTNSATNTNVEKVKEIAAYLKTLKDIYSDKNKIQHKKITQNNNNKEKIEMNHNTLKSKLSIQGVEKPGGIVTENGSKFNVLKTYPRQNRLKNTSFLSTNKCHNAECKVTDVYSNEINTTAISANIKTQEFCICNDFGRLDYYDSNDLYEHIHFCQHHNTHCDLDLILNIYNDDNDDQVVSNQNEIINEHITEEDTETVEFNICWNAFQYRDEKYGTKEISDEAVVLKHELRDEKKHGISTSNVNMKSATEEIISENDNIVNAFNEDGCTIKDNIDNAPNNDIHSPYLKKNEKGDAISASDTNIHNPNLILFLENNVESNFNENVHNSDLISSENSTIISKTNNEPRIKITNVFGMDNVDHDMDYFNDNVIRYESHSTEIDKRQEKSTLNLKIDVNTDEKTDDENLHSTIMNEPSDGKEDNLLRIGKKIARSNPNQDQNTPKKKSNINNKIKRKRSKSPGKAPGFVSSTDEPDAKRKIKCAVCDELVSEKKWENHVIGEHQFIAWRVGDTFDLDDADLQRKLKQSLKISGFLKCTVCNLEFKKLKKFVEHIRTCMKLKDSNIGKEKTAAESNVICGVCKEAVNSSCWIEHIGKYHNYLAWIDGHDSLDLNNEQAVLDHLLQIMKQIGVLRCYKCGVIRKRVKAYLSHVQTCEVDECATSSTSEENQHVKCGVCKEEVANSCWTEHIAKEHNYLAWPDNTQPLKLDDKEAVWEHLQQFIRNGGGLTCYKCGLTRRRVKVYLSHVETCDGSQNNLDSSTVSTDLNTSKTQEEESVEKPTTSLVLKEFMTCGVCKQVISGQQWIEHISKEHDYMAWEDGSTVLDHEDSEAVRLHLYKIAKQHGGLVCNKCGFTRKYVKSYMEHIKECEGVSLDCSKLDVPTENSMLVELRDTTTSIVVCGVCKVEVKKEDWVKHMSTEHEYLAWIDGCTPIDVKDDEEVQKHLMSIIKLVDGFKCAKCDLVRKYAKPYMQHVKMCKASGKETVITAIRNNQLLECAICREKMNANEWRKHAMTQHYNIAWVVGEPDIDLNNPYAVEGYIKEYQQKYNKLICRACGKSRVSRVGFYAHILTCGKSAEEIEMFQDVCEICNNKYLRIYKSQHMTAHRESELSKERKLIAAEEKKKRKDEPVELLSGRRKAAEKAKTVIEKYNKNIESEGSHRCPTCGFSTEIESELSGHVCVELRQEDCSDSDESVNMDQWSDNESLDTDIDSNLSDEELLSQELGSKKKRHSDASARAQRIPFQVNNPRSYLKQSGREFIKTHWSTEDLFTQWRSCEYVAVNEHDQLKYLPPIAESCKIRAADTEEWTTYSRFEARKAKPCTTIFTGACIRCIAWAPSPLDWEVSGSESHYLAVASHVAEDEPREAWEHTATRPALIQIWDYGNMRVAPQFVLGIAMDFGTVWAMDWCPSGARDAPRQRDDNNTSRRLGLLATACSNGSAYIFSVPYPSTITDKDKLFYNLKPVAELRLTMSAGRKVYQATSLKWSPQKGHGSILVGYSDGTMAYYNLNIESPILKTTENNVTILYPYYDERLLNGCIEGVDIYPRAGPEGAGEGAVCGASAAGGGMARAGGCGGGAGGGGRIYSHVAAARAAFLPHWPSAMLVGDDALLSTSVNEMDWWGGVRRAGGARACCACARCGRAALAAHRLLRLHAAHPLYPDLHKLVIGIIDMIPFNDKKKRKQNDDLSMVVEPTTYEGAVKKYGVEYQVVTNKDRVSQQKVSSGVRQPYPERFPLADMTSLAFCSSEQHHDKLAVAVHAGFVLIVDL